MSPYSLLSYTLYGRNRVDEPASILHKHNALPKII